MFQVQIKDTQNSKWRKPMFGQFAFNSVTVRALIIKHRLTIVEN